MTDKTQPEALRLANEFKLCNEYDSIPSITDIAKAEAELRRQHARIAELEAELEAVGAGGVHALSAAPAIGDELRDTLVAVSAAIAERDDRAAQKMICEILAASTTPPAEQQAQPGAVYAELPQPDSWFHFTAQFWENKLYDFADRTHALRMQAASHGQAPAPTHEQIAAYLESTGAYVTNDATREAAIAEAIDTDRAKRGQAPDLHPKTSDLVQRFAAALAEKLSAAEKKYGYSDGWASPNWMDECRQHLSAHIAKGDPRDVAAYCAFLWHHGATTASPQAEQQAPTGSEIYVCARKCYNCGHAGINDDHADNAACKSCDWSGPSPEKDHCPDCEKDGTMTAACPMCSCAYIMVADTQVAAPAALNAPQAAPQQEAQEPCPSCKNSDIYACTCPFPTSRNTAPQPAPAPLSDDTKDAARYRWLINQHWIQTEVDWRLISTDQDSTIKQLDAAIDAALAAQGGKQ